MATQAQEQGDEKKYIYSVDRLYGIIDMTQGNLANMIHRLCEIPVEAFA